MEDSLDDKSCYSYSVKIMSPSRMSDYKVQKWRVTTRFKKISDLVSKLQSSFDELKGDNLTLGCISPGHGAKGKKHWLNVKEDLDDMYEAHKTGKLEILLWCHIPTKRAPKRSKPPADDTSSSKRKCSELQGNDKKLDEVTEIVEALRKEHGASFTPEQLHAWAHLIHIGKHESRVEAPKSPFFRGKSCKKAGNIPSTVAKPEDPSNSAGETSAVSPSKRIALHMKCIEQLEKWHSLLEKTVITQEQYAKLPQSILNDIYEV